MYYQSKDNYFCLYQGNSVQVLSQLKEQVDMIFADPPYFLSNGGKKYKEDVWYLLTKEIGTKQIL